jgi:Ca2+-binding RTX toxin-like protein
MALYTLSNTAGRGFNLSNSENGLLLFEGDSSVTHTLLSDDDSTLVYRVEGSAIYDTLLVEYVDLDGTVTFNKITYANGGVPLVDLTHLKLTTTKTQLVSLSWFVGLNNDWDTFNGSIHDDVLRADTENDYLFGWGGNDALFGDANNDTLIGGSGDDTLDGGSGDDVAFYDLERAYFQVKDLGNGTVRILDMSLVDGTDILSNIEFVEFRDGKYSMASLLADPPPPIPPARYEVKKPLDVKEGADLVFTIERTGTAIFQETVSFALTGSATFGKDYIAQPLNVTFQSGERAKTITLSTVQDGVAETFETVTLRLTGTTNGGQIIGEAATAGLVNIDETIRGNSKSNTLKGFEGNDKLYGNGGNDKLYGGTGNDQLNGGAGKDAFYFDTLPHSRSNKDKIQDFNVVDDVIRLDNAVFSNVGRDGALKASAFWSNNTGKAHDRSDRIIYDKDSGILYYDADGSGKGAAVAFATISKHLSLTYKDFYVV